jgi:hypothetical protein
VRQAGVQVYARTFVAVNTLAIVRFITACHVRYCDDGGDVTRTLESWLVMMNLPCNS